jgi:hypothetical protein
VLARALRDSAYPAKSISAARQLDSYGDTTERKTPLRPILDAAAAMGLGQEVRAALERPGEAPAADLLMIARAHAHDPAVLPQLPAWLGQPHSPQLLWELADLLAAWPEAQAPARTLLQNLPPSPAEMPPAARVEELAHRGVLEARCGLPDLALRDLRQAYAAHDQVQGNQPQILFDVAEGLALCSQAAEAKKVAREWAQLTREGNWIARVFTGPLMELAQSGREMLFRMFADVLKAVEPPRNPSNGNDLESSSSHDFTTNLDDAEHLLAARATRWNTFTPYAWLQSTHPDGTSEIAWTQAWLTGVPGPKERIIKAVPSANPAPKKPVRIDLYGGEVEDRLTRVAFVEKASPEGKWRGRLPANQRFLAVSVTMDGQTVLGRPMPFAPGKNLIPPLETLLAKLPMGLWQRGTSGPAGESLRGVQLNREISPPEPLAPTEIEVSGGLGKDLLISGWVKGGHVNLALLLPDGTRQSMTLQSEFGPSDPWIWRRFEIAAQVEGRGEQGIPGARVMLMLTPGGEYSGLQVISSEAKPRPVERDAELPPSARAPEF